LTKPGPRERSVLPLSPLEFLNRIAALIPPLRKHRHRYFGVLVSSSPRAEIVTSREEPPHATEAEAIRHILEHLGESTAPQRIAASGSVAESNAENSFR